jgi:hypothetical protein
MSDEEGSTEATALLRLRVVAEADPGALVRILGRLQHLNVVPRRVMAEASTTELLHVEIDIVGLTAQHLALLTAKVGQDCCVFNAHWHPVC